MRALLLFTAVATFCVLCVAKENASDVNASTLDDKESSAVDSKKQADKNFDDDNEYDGIEDEDDEDPGEDDEEEEEGEEDELLDDDEDDDGDSEFDDDGDDDDDDVKEGSSDKEADILKKDEPHNAKVVATPADAEEHGAVKRWRIPTAMIRRARLLRRLRNLRGLRGLRARMRKREQVSKPRFVVRDGFVYMKAPAMPSQTRQTVLSSPPTFRHGAPDASVTGHPRRGSQGGETGVVYNRDHMPELLGNPLLLSNTIDMQRGQNPLTHTSIPFQQEAAGAYHLSNGDGAGSYEIAGHHHPAAGGLGHRKRVTHVTHAAPYQSAHHIGGYTDADHGHFVGHASSEAGRDLEGYQEYADEAEDGGAVVGHGGIAVAAACDGDPCHNGGHCRIVEESYECVCQNGYKGNECEERDNCHPNPCHNDGVCTESKEDYVCTCAEGFKGSHCKEVNRCLPNPCHNNAVCTERENDFDCVCTAGFSGKECSSVDRCHAEPCLNGGTCSSSLGIAQTPMMSCTCAAGYNGPRCEVFDKCHTNPCKNGGICRDGTCTCINQFQGTLCETRPSPCSPETCLNGGRCIEKGYGDYKCKCRHGFKGDNCEEESRCEPNPCLNAGVCYNTDQDYRCQCALGFRGTHCEEVVSPCDANPCMNDGRCIVEYNKFKCICKTDFRGVNCETRDPCHRHPCKNSGVCTAGEGEEIRCECSTGFKGKTCEERDHCLPNPCMNSGKCFENADSYTCQCPSGYRGKYCGERDPCHPSPCSHDGVCIAEGVDFRCRCGSGWSGIRCEDEDRCTPNPCQKGGVCVTRPSNLYECHCPSGMAGLNCEQTTAVIDNRVVAQQTRVFTSSSNQGAVMSNQGAVMSSQGAVATCKGSQHGCCPDGETSAKGPNALGCPVLAWDPANQNTR